MNRSSIPTTQEVTMFSIVIVPAHSVLFPGAFQVLSTAGGRCRTENLITEGR